MNSAINWDVLTPAKNVWSSESVIYVPMIEKQTNKYKGLLIVSMNQHESMDKNTGNVYFNQSGAEE